MQGTTVLVLVYVVVGLIGTVLGYLVKYKKMASLITFYDPAKVKDEAELTQWVGLGTLLLGGSMLLFGVGIYALPAWSGFLTMVSVVPILWGLVIAVRGWMRYVR